MPTVLIVCTGNTCRSPVVEGLLRHQLKSKGLFDWIVDSAGTDARVGERATNHSVDSVFEFKGIDIRSHRASQLTAENITSADLIVCMAEVHRTKIEQRFEASKLRCKLLAELAGEGTIDVVDPHGMPRKNYDEMVKRVDQLLNLGIDEICREASANATKRA